MFYVDDDTISNILRYSPLIKLQSNELPNINIDGISYELNTNTPDADIATYFLKKYPKPDSYYYYVIYTAITEFIHTNKLKLIKEKIIRTHKDSSIIDIDTSLFDVILSSFIYNDNSSTISDTKYNTTISALSKAGLIKSKGISFSSKTISHNDIQLIPPPTSNLSINNKNLDLRLVLKNIKSYIKAQKRKDKCPKAID